MIIAEDIGLFSITKINYIIEKMGIVPVKKVGKYRYYTEEQVDLIKENCTRNYQENKFLYFESKMNFPDRFEIIESKICNSSLKL